MYGADFMLQERTMTLRITLGLLGIFIWSISMFAGIDVMSDAVNLRLDTWGGPQPMALPTVMCFLLTGVGFFIIATSNRLWRT